MQQGLPSRPKVVKRTGIMRGGGTSHSLPETGRSYSSPLGCVVISCVLVLEETDFVCRVLYTKTSCVEFSVVPVGQTYEMQLKVGNRSRTDKLVWAVLQFGLPYLGGRSYCFFVWQTVVATCTPPFKAVHERFVVL